MHNSERGSANGFGLWPRVLPKVIGLPTVKWLLVASPWSLSRQRWLVVALHVRLSDEDERRSNCRGKTRLSYFRPSDFLGYLRSAGSCRSNAGSKMRWLSGGRLTVVLAEGWSCSGWGEKDHGKEKERERNYNLAISLFYWPEPTFNWNYDLKLKTNFLKFQ